MSRPTTTGSVKLSSTCCPTTVDRLGAVHQGDSPSPLFTKLDVGLKLLSLVLWMFSSGSKVRLVEMKLWLFTGHTASVHWINNGSILVLCMHSNIYTAKMPCSSMQFWLSAAWLHSPSLSEETVPIEASNTTEPNTANFQLSILLLQHDLAACTDINFAFGRLFKSDSWAEIVLQWLPGLVGSGGTSCII